jgi:hydrogenase expression/formation protein HypC
LRAAASGEAISLLVDEIAPSAGGLLAMTLEEKTMCLGVPGKIIDIYEANGLQMGKVDFGGVTKEICLAYVPEAKLGNYTIVHVGFALNILDEAEALETLQLLREIGAIEEELGTDAAQVQIPSS